MKRARQVTVCLPNKPGMLAKLCNALAEVKVNIVAISVVDTTEACLVRLVPDDARAAVSAIEAKGMSATTTPVRLVELPNKVGALAEMADRLSKRKVNINFAYGSAAPGRRNAIIVVEARKSQSS